ncbi:MAG: ATP-binding cassette domain-containing protein, partial [Bacteroidetes bacterium]
HPYLQQRWQSFDAETAPLVRHAFWPGQELTPYTLDLLKEFDALHLLGKRNIQLSNGELRKIELIRCLGKKPRLLVIDNAFVGLDAASRELLMQLLEQVASQCTLVLLALPQDELPAVIQRRLYCRQMRLVPALDTPALKAGPLPLSFAGRGGEGELVKLQQVHVAYGDTQIFENLNWTIRAGEHWALLGPNGSGKSTLLSLIVADKPQAYARDIYLFGRRKGSGESIWDLKRKMAYISPELHQFLPRQRPVAQVLVDDLAWLYPGIDRQEVARNARRWMQWFGLHISGQRPFGSLSSGEQRLLLFIRVLLYPFELLIADEPCQGLDEAHIQLLRQVFHHLARHSRIATVFVTHRQEELPETTTLLFDMQLVD